MTPTSVSRAKRMVIPGLMQQLRTRRQEDSIIDEMLDPSTGKDHTLSKSKKYIIPSSISPPESED